MLEGDLVARGVCGVLAGGLLWELLTATRRPPDMDLRIAGDRLVVRLRRWDVVWAQRTRLSVPLAAVRGVVVAPVGQRPTSWPLWGTSLPGVMHAGALVVDGEREFWNVRRGAQVLRIELHDGAPFRRLVLELADPGATVSALRPRLGPWVPALL